jgi:protein-tyrosine sulfotransferase
VLPDVAKADPIFILGITPRSGTNFLSDLLCSHPDCSPAREPVHEDLFLQHADLLQVFTSAVHTAWDPGWGSFEATSDRLHQAIGDGLISFLWTERDRRLVTKSPSVRNLGFFFTLFPRARLIILVRDGRSVVQSSMATFGWDFDTAAHLWAEGAEAIRRFDLTHRGLGLPYRIVRYEDLVDEMEPILSELLDFLDLDRQRFDFQAATRLPVRGSSAFFGVGRASVNWEPVEKDHGFAPKQRWRDWSPTLLQRFEWIAGEQLRYFGYQESPPRPGGLLWPAGQRLRDLRWRSGRFARRAGWWAQRQAQAARRARAGSASPSRVEG